MVSVLYRRRCHMAGPQVRTLLIRLIGTILIGFVVLVIINTLPPILAAAVIAVGFLFLIKEMVE